MGAYADDLVVGLGSMNDHHTLRDELESFCYMSGSKVSESKSVFYGTSNLDSPLRYTYKLIEQGFKYLGVHTKSHDWQRVIGEIRYMRRHHNLDGSPLAYMVKAIQTYYFTKIYHCDLHLPMTPAEIKQLDLLVSFFKGYRISQVRRRILQIHGGLGMLDLQEQLYGRRAKQVWLACQFTDEHSRYFKFKLQLAVNHMLGRPWD